MHVIMTDSWPGYWGAGDTEAEALTNLKRSGGRPSKHGTLRFVLHEEYINPWVDVMGSINCTYKGDPETPHEERPAVVKEGWRYGPKGGRKERLR